MQIKNRQFTHDINPSQLLYFSLTCDYLKFSK